MVPGGGAGVTQHISAVTIYPTGTRGFPLLFESLEDACAFARITKRLIWAEVRGDIVSSYRIFPGGRCEMHLFSGRLPRGNAAE
jgi:hypothetical protein